MVSNRLSSQASTSSIFTGALTTTATIVREIRPIKEKTRYNFKEDNCSTNKGRFDFQILSRFKATYETASGIVQPKSHYITKKKLLPISGLNCHQL